MTNIREKKSVLLYSEKSQPYGYRNVIYVLKKKKQERRIMLLLLNGYKIFVTRAYAGRSWLSQQACLSLN